MADDAEVKFGANIEGVIAGIDKVNAKLDELKGVAEGLTGGFLRGIEEELLKVLSVDAIIHFVDSMATLGEETERTMAKLGMSAQQVGDLSAIAQLSGTSLDTLTFSIERMSLQIQRAGISPTSPAALGLKALGVNAKDFINLPADQFFSKLADSVSKFNPSLNLTNALMSIGGRYLTEMIPTLEKGSEGFRRFKEEADKTGDSLTDLQARGFAQTHEKLVLMGMAVEGFGIRIFTFLRPAIDTAIEWVTKFIESLDATKIGNALNYLIDTVAEVLAWLAKAALQAYSVIEEASIRLGYLAEFGVQAFSAKNRDAMFHDLDEMHKGIASRMAAIDATVAETAARIKAAIAPDGRAGGASAAYGGGKGLKQDAPALDTVDKSAIAESVKLQRAASDAIIADARATYAKEVDLIQYKLSIHTISINKAYQAEVAALNKELAAEVRTYQDELKAANLTASQKQAILNKEVAAKAAAELKKQQLAEQTAQREMAYAQKVSGFIFGDFNAQISGLISMTESWGDAFRHTLDGMLTKFIDVIAQMIETWLVLEAIALITGGPTPSLKQVFHAVTGFASGSWNIPKDQLAMVHAGEMIIPSAQADQVRAGKGGLGGGGGQSVVIHYAPNIQALDSAGMDRVLKTHGRKITKMVSHQLNRNPSLRADY